MEVLALGGVVSVLALVGLRSRRTRKDEIQDEGSSSKLAASQSSSEYLPSLLIPCLVGAVLFVMYYTIPQDALIKLKKVDCQGPTPEERAAEWDYAFEHSALRNVSHEDNARRLFNQGLLLRFGYSPEGAWTSFSAASEVDATCAMCYWGLAYAVAPFLNIVALPDDTRHPYYSIGMNREGRESLKKAEKGPFRSPRHRSYIEAMWIRFPQVEAVERRHQEWREFLYGSKMLSLWLDDPDDLTAASLAAEAYANYGPWEFHKNNPQPSIDDMSWKDLIKVAFPDADVSEFESVTGIESKEKVLSWLVKDEEMRRVAGTGMRPMARLVEYIILKILEVDDAHPMGTHLHIHLVEASKGREPNKALASAMNLDRVSREWKSGHLIHMPSHLYFRVGEHRKGVELNEIALEMDIETSKSCMDPYVPEHNLKVLIASASMGGLLEEAETYATKIRKLSESITMTKYLPSGWDYVALLDIWGHFGQWEKILTADPPSEGARGGSSSGGWEYSQAMYHFYRTMAFSHITQSGRRLLEKRYETERDLFLKAAEKVPPAQTTIPGEGIGVYSAGDLEKTKMASLYLQARNASLHGDMDQAIGFVQDVLELVKSMGYMEPPRSQQPPKQCLGYLLLQNKQYTQAKQIYEEDLDENPKNPWSLVGSAQLAIAMERQNDAKAFLSDFEFTRSVQLDSSCPMLFMG